MLSDLSQIYDFQSKLAKEFLSSSKTELELTDVFKTKYESVVNSQKDKIVFEKYSAKLRTGSSKFIIIPNQWFYLAFLAAPYYNEFLNYKSLLLDKLKDLHSKVFEEFCKNAKSGTIDNELFEVVKLDLEEQDINYLEKFLSDYNWWHGGKTIDRGDSFVSPILSLLHLINASAEYVAIITHNLVHNDFNLQNCREYFILPNLVDLQEGTVSEVLAEYNKITCNKRMTPIQQIHFGAPGTGKSYSLSQIIGESYKDYKETDDNPYIFRTTIHNEYSYYDFVGNVMPTVDNGQISYDFKAGIFTQALDKALANEDYDIYLIVEEMSRGNVAAIFGDIFQLLDRDASGESEYRINNELIYAALSPEAQAKLTENKIYLPSNLHLLGTVNTSDQNVNVLDTAFKRRFGFVYQSVKPAINRQGQLLNTYTFELGGEAFEWNDFYQKLNQFIVSEDGLGLNEDKQIGQFFVKFKAMNGEMSDEDKARVSHYNFNQIRNKVLHYLWEDVQQASVTDNKLFVPQSFTELYEKFTPETAASEIFAVKFY